jgi:hypothetical protein
MDWFLKRFGVVLGRDGKGGSGIFVRSLDGRIGLITAAHVLFPCIHTGHISIVRCINGYEKGKSIKPEQIRVSSDSDAAILYLPEGIYNECLDVAEWNPNSVINLEHKQAILNIGLPGLWKQILDVEKWKLGYCEVLALQTEYNNTNSNYPTLIGTRFDEQPDILPNTFAGMSGGPVFDLNKKFLGINTLEVRMTKEGYIYMVASFVKTNFQPI